MKHSATTWGGDTTGDYACLNFESCADAVPRNPALTSGQDAAKGVIRHKCHWLCHLSSRKELKKCKCMFLHLSGPSLFVLNSKSSLFWLRPSSFSLGSLTALTQLTLGSLSNLSSLSVQRQTDGA